MSTAISGRVQKVPTPKSGEYATNDGKNSLFFGHSHRPKTAGSAGSNWFPDGPADEDIPSARLIDGARRGPLEDSGGFPGYEEIIDALADPSHPDHAEHSAWVADTTGSVEPFDPVFLDIRAVNRTLGMTVTLQ